MVESCRKIPEALSQSRCSESERCYIYFYCQYKVWEEYASKWSQICLLIGSVTFGSDFRAAHSNVEGGEGWPAVVWGPGFILPRRCV